MEGDNQNLTWNEADTCMSQAGEKEGEMREFTNKVWPRDAAGEKVPSVSREQLLGFIVKMIEEKF